MKFGERSQRLFVLLFVVYVTFIGGTVYTGQILFLTRVFQTLVTGILVGWLGYRLWKKQGLPQTPLDFPLLAYVVWLLVTSVASEDSRISFELVWRYLIHVGGFYLVVAIMQAGHQRWLFEALGVNGGVIVMLSAVEIGGTYLRIPALSLFNLEGGSFVTEVNFIVPIYFYRLSLAFNLSTVLSNYLAILIPVLLAWALTVERRDNRIGIFILSGVLALLQVLTFTRAGFVAMFIGIGLFTFLVINPETNWRAWLKPKRLIPIAIIGVIGIAGLGIIAISRGLIIEGESFRRDMFGIAFKMIGERPIAGYGVNQFPKQYWERFEAYAPYSNPPTAHNILLNTGAEMGLIGIAILIWLGVVIVRLWWKKRQTAPRAYRWRLDGIMAAFVALTAHSMLDMFTSTPSIVPLIFYAGYLVAGTYTSKPSYNPPHYDGLRRWLPLIPMLMFMGYWGWLWQSNAAQSDYRSSIQAIFDDDLEAALAYSESAHDKDPDFELYPIQRAYVLGLLAEENPAAYLNAAIEAHEVALENHPSFHVGVANLAVLYGQRGDYAKAVELMQQAIHVGPEVLDYYLMLGAYQEALGDVGSAEANYRLLLGVNPIYLLSDFWHQPPLNPDINARQNVFEESYTSASIGLQFWLDFLYGDLSSEQLQDRYDVVRAMPDKDLYIYLALGDYVTSQENHDEALAWYNEGLAAIDMPLLRIERGFAYLAVGNTEKARQDAEAMLDLQVDDILKARANYLLALVEIAENDSPPDDRRVNGYLQQTFLPVENFGEYTSVVFLRPSAILLLPQRPIIQPYNYRELYAPYLLLADRFAADDDPNTKPERIYRAVPHELRPAATVE